MDEIVTLGDSSKLPLKDAVDCTIREVITALHAASGAPRNAMLFMMNHMSANWRSLYVLDRHGASDAALLSHSKAILFRSMFDVYLQFEYLTQADTVARATLYLDYEHVELYQQATKAVKRNDGISKYIASSPMRAQGEPALKARYDAVVGAYTSTKGNVRSHWYPQSNLGLLSTDVGKNDEYFWFTQRFNSSVHGGPLAAHKGTPADHFLLFAGVLMCRVADLVAKHHELQVSVVAQSTIDAFSREPLTEI